MINSKQEQKEQIKGDSCSLNYYQITSQRKQNENEEKIK